VVNPASDMSPEEWVEIARRAAAGDTAPEDVRRLLVEILILRFRAGFPAEMLNWLFNQPIEKLAEIGGLAMKRWREEKRVERWN
jgi:hypothetical protein